MTSIRWLNRRSCIWHGHTGDNLSVALRLRKWACNCTCSTFKLFDDGRCRNTCYICRQERQCVCECVVASVAAPHCCRQHQRHCQAPRRRLLRENAFAECSASGVYCMQTVIALHLPPASIDCRVQMFPSNAALLIAQLAPNTISLEELGITTK